MGIGKRQWAVISTLLVLGACAQPLSVTVPESTPSPETVSETSACRNDGARLPLSGLCEDVALKTLNTAAAEALPLPEGCEWHIQETPFANDLLLYLAAKCGDATSQLDYSAGARQAKLGLSKSALGSDVSGETALITVLGSDPEAPLKSFERFALDMIGDNAEEAKCEIREANLDGWPADAFVLDDISTTRRTDGPRAACGPFGYDEGGTQYWRVFQNFSWFFNLGQDAYLDFDPQSLTLLTRDEAGDWSYLEASAPVLEGILEGPEHFNDKDRDACIASGGKYEMAGLLGHFQCTLPYADAGAVCSDRSDCEGRCLAGEDADFDPTGETSGQTGFCQADDNSFGCFSDVIEGVVQPALCID